MLRTETKIIRYLQQLSKGLVTISMEQAADIINMVKETQQYQAAGIYACAKLYRWNATVENWEIMQVIPTTDELISQRILEELDKGPVNFFYRYILLDSNGDQQGCIYSANANLF